MAVPEVLQVAQADMTPERFAEAVGWVQGPPTLEWCQMEALCTLCACYGEHCKFKELILDSY
ncbi:hypothetical protein C0989_008326 [Termitomyces sp. Mn162]|nr:hypothetical protein C0989_008326 [Termitomyces sp. Mn162]